MSSYARLPSTFFEDIPKIASSAHKRPRWINSAPMRFAPRFREAGLLILPRPPGQILQPMSFGHCLAADAMYLPSEKDDGDR